MNNTEIDFTTTPGHAPFPEFPSVVVGSGAMAGCLILLIDGRERLLCDFDHPQGPGGCTLHTAIRLLRAGAQQGPA